MHSLSKISIGWYYFFRKLVYYLQWHRGYASAADSFHQKILFSFNFIIFTDEIVSSSGQKSPYQERRESSCIPNEAIRSQRSNGKVTILVFYAPNEKNEKDHRRDS